MSFLVRDGTNLKNDGLFYNKNSDPSNFLGRDEVVIRNDPHAYEFGSVGK